MPVTDWVVIRLDNVMRRTMKGWQHMAQLVKHGQIIKCRIAPFIIQITQIGRARHWHKNRMTPTQLYIFFGITGIIGEFCRNGGNQFIDKSAIKIDALINDFGPSLAPVGKGDWVTKHYPNIF